MTKRAEPNPQFDNFTAFMDKLAQVPHSELKARLDAEQAARKAQKRMFANGGHLSLRSEDNLLLDVMNDVLLEERKRKVN
jgi:hypothetical protein